MATAAGGVFGLCVLNHSASFFSPLYFPSFQDKACLLDFSWLSRWPASGGFGCLKPWCLLVSVCRTSLMALRDAAAVGQGLACARLLVLP